MGGRFLGKQFTSFQIIIAGFLAVILVGALLLALPVSFKKELLHELRRHENIEVFRKPAVPFQTVVPALFQ